MSVPVFDGRPARDRENTIPPEVDENVAQSMRDELLFEQYGGCRRRLTKTTADGHDWIEDGE